MYGTMINQFSPDYAIHPGEILEETLEARGIKKGVFAKSCGLSDKTISLIISGKAPITPETSIQFERVLGISATIWNNLEGFYRLHKAQDAAQKELEQQVEWANTFPIKELIKRKIFSKIVSPSDLVEKLLIFFGVGSVHAFNSRYKEISVAYRHSPSFKSAPHSVATWLRLGELCAQTVSTSAYNKGKFNKALKEIRALTTEPPEIFEPKMKELCREAGVALIFLSEFPGTHLSGATRWLNKDKALIMLSLRHKSDDHFWFSFFHEAAHVLLHGKRGVFLDEMGMMSGGVEDEANHFAANILIAEPEYLHFISRRQFTKRDILVFSDKIDIIPGIIVGRLQHDEKIPYSWHNELKRKFKFKDIQ